MQWPTIMILRKKARVSDTPETLLNQLLTYDKPTKRAHRPVHIYKLTYQSLRHQESGGYSGQTYPGFAGNQQGIDFEAWIDPLRRRYRGRFPASADCHKQSWDPMHRHRFHQEESQRRQWDDQQSEDTQCQSGTDESGRI